MIRTVFAFAILLLSCGQPTGKVTTKVTDTNPSTDSVPDLAEDPKVILDSLFLLKRDLPEFSSQDMWFALKLGHLFSMKYKDAVLRYNDQYGSENVNVIILRQAGKDWDTIFTTRMNSLSPTAYDEMIEITDFNGDNIPDLKIMKEHWDIHSSEISDLWLYNDNHFTKVKGFDRIVNAEYDKKTNLIYSYHSNGCADMAMYFGVFKIVGNEVSKIKEMDCDCCTDNDSCSIEIFGKKPYSIPRKQTYKYVPVFYSDFIKNKCR